MVALTPLATLMNRLLGIPIKEIKQVARREFNAGLAPQRRRGRSARQFTVVDGARLLVGVLVTQIEGSAAQVASLMQDIARLSRLHHGAPLYFDRDFILSGNFVEAVGDLLRALADPARRDRARGWIGGIGIMLGGSRMGAWIEVRSQGETEWEDFDYAIDPDDLVFIVETAPMMRSVELKTAALMEIAMLLAPDVDALSARRTSSRQSRESAKRHAR